MKTLIFLFILAVSSPAFCQVDVKAQSLISLHKKKFDWLINKKTDSLSLLLDEKVMYIHSNGVVESKAEVLDHLKSGLVSYKNVQVDEAKARFYGDTGIITGRGTFEGKWGDNTFSLSLSYTEVYVKIKKQWMLVSRAACRIIE
jgi:hypothetical protein